MRNLDTERLGKLLAMLESPVDGEVLNAGRAIGRLFSEAGSDLITVALRLITDAARHVEADIEAEINAEIKRGSTGGALAYRPETTVDDVLASRRETALDEVGVRARYFAQQRRLWQPLWIAETREEIKELRAALDSVPPHRHRAREECRILQEEIDALQQTIAFEANPRNAERLVAQRQRAERERQTREREDREERVRRAEQEQATDLAAWRRYYEEMMRDPEYQEHSRLDAQRNELKQQQADAQAAYQQSPDYARVRALQNERRALKGVLTRLHKGHPIPPKYRLLPQRLWPQNMRKARPIDQQLLLTESDEQPLPPLPD
jgi:hypothetical protein